MKPLTTIQRYKKYKIKREVMDDRKDLLRKM
jgi:hypothetical protein